jgi:hypothetical protein
MLDTVKESARVTDETIRNVSESIGEIRSMVFQVDAELKENSIKMEKIEDDITEVRPQEIAKKIREFNDKFEKNQLKFEMLERKTSDSGEKINKIFEMLKSIGGVENLVNVNKEIQQKINDIKEAMKYIERIGTKTEKIFVDLNKGLQDLVIIRAQQEDFNESLKDMVKNIDGLNVKFEGYITKKDLDSFKEDNILIKKQIEDIKKVLPIAELKLPESIINLRKEREDIKLLLDSLEDQTNKGKISKIDYEAMKNANMKKLENIRVDLEKEWKKIGKLLNIPEKEGSAEEKPEEIKEEKVEEKKEEVKQVIESKTEEKPEEEVLPAEEKKKPLKEEKKSRKVKKEIKEEKKVEKSEKVEAEAAKVKEEEIKNKEIEEIKKKMEYIKETFEKKKKESIFNEETKAEEPKEEKIVEETEKEVVKKEEPKKEVKVKKKTEPHKVIKKVVVKKTKTKKPIMIKKKRKNIISEEKRKSEILKGLKRIS